MKAFLRANLILLISACAAGITLLTTPATGWWRAIDLRTINLLFCLMVVIAGFRATPLFPAVAGKLTRNCRTPGRLAQAIILLTFFSSMLITNDIALIAFVPFALYIFTRLNLTRLLPSLITLQAVAANLGSIATPIGNPQNLFLYTACNLTPGDFFGALVPLTSYGLTLLIAITGGIYWTERELLPSLPPEENSATGSTLKPYLLFSILFLLCIATVFRLFPDVLLFGIVLLTTLIASRKTLLKVDYALLLTFVCFFIFSHNLATVPALKSALEELLISNTQATAFFASQFLSNVPTAILLKPFTTDWQALLLGVDIGGFGTPIASLASLIALNLYFKESTAKPGKTFLWFFALNLFFALALTLLSIALQP